MIGDYKSTKTYGVGYVTVIYRHDNQLELFCASKKSRERQLSGQISKFSKLF